MSERHPNHSPDTCVEGAILYEFTVTGVPGTPEMAALRKGRPSRTPSGEPNGTSRTEVPDAKPTESETSGTD